MNFGELKTLARMSVPTAKENVISNTQLGLIINQATKEIATNLRFLQADKKFTIVNDRSEYNITTQISAERYAGIAKSGVWFNEGSVASPDWGELDPVTEKWLDTNKMNWRDNGSSIPEYYYIKGNSIYLIDKPNADLTDGGWLYYFQHPPVMSNDSHFPFNSGSTEFSQYSILTDAIILYYKWIAEGIIAEEEKKLTARKEYLEELTLKGAMLNRRLDISNNRKNRYQGRKYYATHSR